MELNVLLVEDWPEDYEQLVRDIPEIFISKGTAINLDPKSSFEDGMKAIQNPHVRYDLVISDTYKGKHKNRDAAVLEMVAEYRKGKFCPLIICSSGQCPAELEISAFVKWVDKTDPKHLENAINEILELGIPQTARMLHDEIEKAAGEFLWGFLDKHWLDLNRYASFNAQLMERIIRRRAALILSDLIPGQYTAINEKYGLEYYIYPSLDHDYFSLGDIIKNKDGKFRVILTPHCLLYVQSGQDKPRADYVLTVKTVSAQEVLGDKLAAAKNDPEAKKIKKLKSWANSPAQTELKPKGRHWYLPQFLEIPHLYCDFLQLESVEYQVLKKDYVTIATLLPPYAEALQQCFSSFYGAVGIPKIDPATIKDLIS